MEGAQNTGRVLSQMERLLYWMNIAYGGPMLTHEIVFDSSKVIEKSQVSQAFEILVRRQTAMQMRVVADATDPSILRFKPMESLHPLNINFRKASRENVLALISEEIGNQVDVTKGPLWCATFVEIVEAAGQEPSESTKRTYAVDFTCHHSLSDGISCFDLLGRQFLPLIADIVSGKEVLSEGQVLIPQSDAFESALTQRTSNKESAKEYENTDTADRASPFVDVKLVFPNDEIPGDVKKPYLASFKLDQQVTAAIVTKARFHGIRVHSVLLTAVGVALSQTAEAARINLPEVLHFGWFINLRRFLHLQSPLPLGYYVGGAYSELPNINGPSNKAFWDICKHVHSQVTKLISAKQSSKEDLIRSVQSCPYEDRVMNHFARFRQPGISNLGVCQQSGDTSVVHLREYYRSEWYDNNDVAPHCFFHGIATVEGCLYWTATVNAKVVGKRFMDKHMRQIKGVLTKYCVDE